MIHVLVVKTQADSDRSADLTYAINNVLDRLENNGEAVAAVQVLDVSSHPEVEADLRRNVLQNVTLCVTLGSSKN